MRKKINEETASEARELRHRGKTYAEISNCLDISLDWCKKNLKGIRTHKEEVVSELITKSRTKHGVSKGEIVQALDPENTPEGQLRKEVVNTVQKIRKQSKENVVRPNWMMPEFSSYILHKVMESSMLYEQRMHEDAQELHTVLMNSCTEDEQKNVPSVQSLKSAMAVLTNAMTNQSSKASSITSNWLESLYTTAVKLEQRNTREIKDISSKFVLPAGLTDTENYVL